MATCISKITVLFPGTGQLLEEQQCSLERLVHISDCATLVLILVETWDNQAHVK